MRHRTGVPAVFLCLALSYAAGALPVDQEKSGKPGKIEPTKTEGKQDDRTKLPKPAQDSRISVRVKVSAEGMNTLPPGSTIELKGDDEACGNLTRPQQNLEPDETTFPDLPVCRVRFRIIVTGFSVKAASVDLAKYRAPMKILVKRDEPPVVSFGSAD